MNSLPFGKTIDFIKNVDVIGQFTNANSLNFSFPIFVDFVPDIIILRKTHLFYDPSQDPPIAHLEGIIKVTSDMVDNASLFHTSLSANYIANPSWTPPTPPDPPDPFQFFFYPYILNEMDKKIFFNKSNNMYRGNYNFYLSGGIEDISTWSVDVQIALEFEFIKFN